MASADSLFHEDDCLPCAGPATTDRLGKDAGVHTVALNPSEHTPVMLAVAHTVGQTGCIPDQGEGPNTTDRLCQDALMHAVPHDPALTEEGVASSFSSVSGQCSTEHFTPCILTINATGWGTLKRYL